MYSVYGALASEEANHDPIDLAFLSAVSDRNVTMEGFIRKSFTPFDPKTRRTGAVAETGGKTFSVVKGAVNIIADLVDADVNAISQQTSEYASKGYRTLAVAMGDDERSLRIVGLVALYDIPRPDAKKLIGELKDLGISVKMLTGDALAIAKETARQVGLSDAITTSIEFEKALETDPAEASEIAEKSDGFAEIYPHDKYSIVKSLQRQSHIVGMTGDGVNDAPSLKQAEVGIAVSSATDVAKGAASVVLTGEGLGNIVDLIRVGRMMHQRMLTWIFNKVVKTFQIVVFVVVAFLLTDQFIVSVFDVVLLLFVIDFVTLSISTDNVRGSHETGYLGSIGSCYIFPDTRCTRCSGIPRHSLYRIGAPWPRKRLRVNTDVFLCHSFLLWHAHRLCCQGKRTLLGLLPEHVTFLHNPC